MAYTWAQRQQIYFKTGNEMTNATGCAKHFGARRHCISFTMQQFGISRRVVTPTQSPKYPIHATQHTDICRGESQFYNRPMLRVCTNKCYGRECFLGMGAMWTAKYIYKSYFRRIRGGGGEATEWLLLSFRPISVNNCQPASAIVRTRKDVCVCVSPYIAMSA